MTSILPVNLIYEQNFDTFTAGELFFQPCIERFQLVHVIFQLKMEEKCGYIYFLIHPIHTILDEMDSCKSYLIFFSMHFPLRSCVT